MKLLKVAMILCASSSTIHSSLLTKEDVMDLCQNTCLKFNKGVCIEKGYHDCKLVTSIAYVESHFRTESLNPDGSYGLMQVQCPTAMSFGFKGDCNELFNPTVNMRYALSYLKYLDKKLYVAHVQDDIVSSYNTGIRRNGKEWTPFFCKKTAPVMRKECQGEYVNSKYVNDVRLFYRNNFKDEAKKTDI